MMNVSGLGRLRGVAGEDGSAIVEMALSSAILFGMLVGVFELCLALFAYHVTADAARQATRWAMVRGSTSCTNTPGLAECNATAANIQSYVTGLGYLNLTTSDTAVNWYTASSTQPTTWTLCSSGTCNVPGSEVQVKVTYPFSLNIPFVSSTTLNLTSTSQMVVSQ